ncbi:MAG: NAD(P)/FAD-dependent oxidoreductase, partial [Chloroflexi bacterium]|nr:NAD(P)/FAD-dependent oxidoreductase [Chloroflexota bacterium]
MTEKSVIVIGAGPAGLTAAWELVKRGHRPIVLEKYHTVGGIARTEEYKGYRFDIGGHRFFTKVPEVNELWHTWMGPEFLRRPRLSRIFYDGKFFHYPLRAFNALANMGIVRSFAIVLSYIQFQIFPYPTEENFEQWVTNRFGRQLYEIFFKTYTEKVWGIPCTEIRAEWAAQRIKGLSLPAAIKNALFKPRGEVIKTLIEEFEYPAHGPGMMWEYATRAVEGKGGEVRLGCDVVRVVRDGWRVTAVAVSNAGEEKTIPGDYVISSMPLAELICKLDPPAPPGVIDAARRLSYRDFLTVVLIVNRPHLFEDNWIYIHSPEVKVGRVQNFKNWSPHMVPDPNTSSLGLEYFCTEGDALWRMPDADLIDLGKREAGQIGLARAADVIDGVVVRQQKAYPVYDSEYAGHLETIKTFLADFENFQTVGRNGLHKYNNQDHSMLTAILAVRNLDGEAHDLWQV